MLKKIDLVDEGWLSQSKEMKNKLECWIREREHSLSFVVLDIIIQRCKKRKNEQERPFFSKELAQHILAYFSIF